MRDGMYARYEGDGVQCLRCMKARYSIQGDGVRVADVCKTEDRRERGH